MADNKYFLDDESLLRLFGGEVVDGKWIAPETKTIRYNWISSGKAGVTKGWKDDIESLGMRVWRSEAITIADCIMVEVSYVPETLPSYIQVVDYKIS